MSNVRRVESSLVIWLHKILLGPKKAVANLRKHGVSFEEASTVFHDAFSVIGSDTDHSVGEHRFVTFGNSIQNRLVVAHIEENERIRIISAHRVTRQERRIYEEGE